MNTLTTKHALVLWTAEHSKVQDFSTKAFAEKLCLMMEDGNKSIDVVISDVAEQMGISRSSAQKYLKTLDESGEWSVSGRRGISTTITPTFLPEAVLWLKVN